MPKTNLVSEVVVVTPMCFVLGRFWLGSVARTMHPALSLYMIDGANFALCLVEDINVMHDQGRLCGLQWGAKQPSGRLDQPCLMISVRRSCRYYGLWLCHMLYFFGT